MSVNLVVTDYNLTLVPQPPPDGGQITLELAELAQILHDPVVEGETWRAVSARDQLSVVIRPPSAAVIDHNGAPPARPQMVAATIGLIEMFGARGFSTQAYGWNIQGELAGVEARDTINRLVDTRRLTDVLGNRGHAWSVPQLTLSMDVEAAGANRINVALRVVAEPGDHERLTFDANAHYAREPDISQLHDEGAMVWVAINEIIRRLTE